MRIGTFLLVGILGLALAEGTPAAWQWWQTQRSVETTEDAYVEADIAPVSSRVAGHVRTIDATDNQTVAAGDVLAILDDTEYAARVAQAQAAVDMRQAALAVIDAKVPLERANIDAAAAAVAGAEADHARTHKDLDRFTALLGTQNISRQGYDGAAAEAAKAEAALARSRAVLAAGTRQIGILSASRRQAEAELRHAETALQLARIDLGNTILRAPVAGIVGNRAIQVGQYLRPGALVLSIVPLDHLRVVANFKETQLRRMRVGQPVGIRIDAYPGLMLAGNVESFSPASGATFSLLPAVNATGNFVKIVQRVPVRIAFAAAPAGLLRPGLSVVAAVDVGTGGSLPAGMDTLALATPFRRTGP
jgi:membrane fusion protein (multidrug efflux system)